MQSRFIAQPMPEERMDHFMLRGPRFLFVSRKPDPELTNQTVNEEYICWQYRASALEFIKTICR